MAWNLGASWQAAEEATAQLRRLPDGEGLN